MGVDGVNVAGVESLLGGDVSTSRQDTDGDLICCNRMRAMTLKITNDMIVFSAIMTEVEYNSDFGQIKKESLLRTVSLKQANIYMHSWP